MRRRTCLTALVVVVLALGTVVAARECGDRVLRAFGVDWGLDIDKAMDAAGVAPGMIVGEAGAGDGYFTLPMARRVGASGAVYANDISRRALDSLAASAKRDGLSNIQTVEGAVDDPRQRIDSMMMAIPCPPPMHMVMRP